LNELRLLKYCLFSELTEVNFHGSLIGTTQEGTFRGSTNANVGELYIKMKELSVRNKTTFQFVDDVKEELEKAARSANETAELSLILQSSTGSSPHTLSFSVRDSNKLGLSESVDKIYQTLNNLKDVNELTTDLMEKVD
jgi:hydrophobic/amphiphilic exporter-1 (mainly G- bacteria), HAE1 family